MVAERVAPKKSGFFNIKGIIALAVILVILDVAVAYALAPLVTAIVQKTITQITPAKFEIGRVELHPLLLRLTVTDLKVYDPKDPSVRIFKGDKLYVQLDPIAILSRRTGFSKISVNGAELEVVQDPDGGFNVGRLAGEKKDESKLDMIKKAVGLKENDWFKRAWNGVRDNLKKRKEAREKAPVQKTSVRELPKGRIVEFKTHPKPIVEIGAFDLNNATFALRDGNQALPPLRKVDVTARKLKIGEGGAVAFESLHLDGVVETAKPGSFDISLDQKKDAFYSKADIQNIDMKAFEPLYSESLPVVFEEGYLTLKSDSRIAETALDSKNQVHIEGHRLDSRKSFGIMDLASGPVLMALNNLPKFDLSFNIGGTPDKPSFSGFQESLMNLVKDDLAGGIDKSLKEKAVDLKDKAGQKLGELGGKLKDLF